MSNKFDIKTLSSDDTRRQKYVLCRHDFRDACITLVEKSTLEKEIGDIKSLHKSNGKKEQTQYKIYCLAEDKLNKKISKFINTYESFSKEFSSEIVEALDDDLVKIGTKYNTSISSLREIYAEFGVKKEFSII